MYVAGQVGFQLGCPSARGKKQDQRYPGIWGNILRERETERERDRDRERVCVCVWLVGVLQLGRRYSLLKEGFKMQPQWFGPYPIDSRGRCRFWRVVWSELCSGGHTGAVVHRCLLWGDRGGWEICWEEVSVVWGRHTQGLSESRAVGGSAEAAWEQACSPSPFPVFTCSSRALSFAVLSLGLMKFNFQGVSWISCASHCALSIRIKSP